MEYMDTSSPSTPYSTQSAVPAFSFSDHLSQSWEMFSRSLWQYVVIRLLGFFISILITAVVMGLAFAMVYTQVDIPALQAAFESEEPTLFLTLLPSLGPVFIQLAAGLLISGIISWLVNLWLSSAIVYLVDPSTPTVPDVGTVLPKARAMVMPMVGLSLMFFLLSGSAWVFLFPYLVIFILISMAAFIVLYKQQPVITAINMSINLVKKHFGFVFGRIVLIFLMFFVNAILINEIFDEFAILVQLPFNFFTALFSVSYAVTLFRHLERREAGKFDGTTTTWVWLVAGIGWVVALLVISAAVRFVTANADTLRPSIMNAFTSMYDSDQIRDSGFDLSEYEYTMFETGCGISMPQPHIVENDSKRVWRYSEVFVTNFPAFAETSGDVLLATMRFASDTDHRSNYERGFVGVRVYCQDNPDELTLDEYVELVGSRDDQEVTINPIEDGDLGVLDGVHVSIKGLSEVDGNYYNNLGFLALSPSGKQLLFIQPWTDGTDEVNQMLRFIRGKISDHPVESVSDSVAPMLYKTETGRLETKPKSEERAAAPAAAAPAAPSCTTVTIYDGEFASNKCYSKQDADALHYNLRKFNSATNTINFSESKLRIVCSDTGFFGDECDKTKAEKTQAEQDRRDSEAQIRAIVARGR